MHDGDDNREVFVCFYLPLSVAAQITVQRHGQQGANIAIAIRSPSTQQGNISLFNLICHSEPLFSSLLSLPIYPVPNANSNCLSTNADPIPEFSFVLGPMMTPSEVQQLMAPEPESGEYLVIVKGLPPMYYGLNLVFLLRDGYL